jgi:hypothetical protein
MIFYRFTLMEEGWNVNNILEDQMLLTGNVVWAIICLRGEKPEGQIWALKSKGKRRVKALSGYGQG